MKMVAHQITHAELAELTAKAAAIGASCPTDEYLAEHPVAEFLAVPVMRTTDEHTLVALTALNPETMKAEYEPPQLPNNLSVDAFFGVIDGSRRTQRQHVALVFLEVPGGWQDAQPDERRLLLPLKVGRWYQREGLEYMARTIGGPAGDRLKAEAAKLR